MLLRHADTQQAELLQPADNAVAVEVVLSIVFPDVRCDFPGGPLPHRLREQAVFVRGVEAGHAGLRKRISR